MQKGKGDLFESRLRKLEDVEAIRSLRMRYHYFINEGLFDRVDELFTDEAAVHFIGVGEAKGRKEIREFFLKLPKNMQLLKQFIHNHIVDVENDEASGIAYLDARYARDGQSIIVAAKFTEKYQRINSGWKISNLQLDVYFSVSITDGWAERQLTHLKPLA